MFYPAAMTNHDRLFKELLSTFFVEFLDLFLPRIYSIVVFSFDEPLREEPCTHCVEFAGLKVLEFNFAPIQLNRLH
jgi:hypothetical protein